MRIYTYDHTSVRLLTRRPTRFARQGPGAATWRTSRGRRLGPYYRLAWRDRGRQRSIYLGRPVTLVVTAACEGDARTGTFHCQSRPETGKTDELLPVAHRVIDRIVAEDSELLELWKDSDSFNRGVRSVSP